MWNVTRTADSETRTVKICAKDRPGLFSKIAGVFTLNNIDIIDAQVFTWRNKIAVDIFEVKPPPGPIVREEERWLRAEDNLEDALAGKLDLAGALHQKITGYRRKKSPLNNRPNRIKIDNHSSSFFTIIEVFTYDYPGLLFNITDALFASRLDIWVAKIATKVDQSGRRFLCPRFRRPKSGPAGAGGSDQIHCFRTTDAENGHGMNRFCSAAFG